MVIHINSIHKIDGVNFVKPSDIFAKLFEAIPNEIPTAKNRYPNKGFKNYSFDAILLTKGLMIGAIVKAAIKATGNANIHE